MAAVQLKALQQGFDRLLRSRNIQDHSTLQDLVKGIDIVERERRISIYRESFLNRLSSSLRDDFPATIKLLGAEDDYLLTEYIYAGATNSWTLAEAGNDFSDFLKKQLPPAKKWIADVAHFEMMLLKLESTQATSLIKDYIFINSTIQLLRLSIKCPDEVGKYQCSESITPMIIWSSGNTIYWEEISEKEYAFFEAIIKTKYLDSVLSQLNLKKTEVTHFFTKWSAKECILGTSS